jgi:hypothetical protein
VKNSFNPVLSVSFFLFSALLLSGCGSMRLNIPAQAVAPPEKNLKNCLMIDGIYEATTSDAPHLYLTRGLMTREFEVQMEKHSRSAPGIQGFSQLWVALKTAEDGKNIKINFLSNLGGDKFIEIAQDQMGKELSCTTSYWESARAYDIFWGQRDWRKLQEHSKLALLPSGDLLMDYTMNEWMDKSGALQKREAREIKAVFKRVDASPEDLLKKTEKGKLAIENYPQLSKDYRHRCTVTIQFTPWGGTWYLYDPRVSEDGKELPPLSSLGPVTNIKADYCTP